MQRTALFRADASLQLGGGHLRRCLVLADALHLAGWACTFAVLPGSTHLVPHLARSVHRVIALESSDADALAEATRSKFDLAVIDHYGLDSRFERRCRTFAARILVIDDLANRTHDCDILLDPTLGRAANHYRALVGGDTKLLLGPAHALMEPGFFRRRLALSASGADENRVFVSFGAADSGNLSAKVIVALRAMGRAMRIDVAVGGASPNVESLRQIAAGDVALTNVVVDSDDIPGMMAGAQIAIGAGGGMAWERCCLGLPSLIITVADNQLENAAALQEIGAARWIGRSDTVSKEVIANAAAALIEDASARQTMHAAALTTTDGLGANRTVSAIHGRVKSRDGAFITLRPTAWKDCDVMFAWQTAPAARRYARNPQAPSRREHEAWFSAKLADPKCVFNVILRNDEPVGLLRYDWHQREQVFEVSILLAVERQGQGVASAALMVGRRLLPDFAFVADVDPMNAASVALFKNAGYRRIDKRKFLFSPFDAASSCGHDAAPAMSQH
jgi:UDP-2,4-diacetamido-2,4,6-trideoxy-beta-L-altropyranose hydrolase